jgi:type VI secretion system protein ImpL
VELTTDGQKLTFDHSAPTSARFQWPGSAGSSGAKVSFVPVGTGSTPVELTTAGDWGWFHLLDQANIRSRGALNRISVTFAADGHNAVFDMQAGSLKNPFIGGLPLRFHCPWAQ